MSTHINLLSFTDQGIRNIKDSPERTRKFTEMATEMGVKVKSVYWTVGHYDIVVITEGSEEVTAALLLKLRSLGNVRSETMRGYTADEFKEVINKLL